MSRNEDILNAIVNGTPMPEGVPESRNEALFMGVGEKINKLNTDLSVKTDSILSSVLDLKSKTIDFYCLNLFNPTSVVTNKYVGENGELEETDACFASDFINVDGIDTVSCSMTHRISFYNENKVWVSNPVIMASIDNDISFNIPSGVKYLRFSAFNDALTTAQVGLNVTRGNYLQYGVMKSPSYTKTVSKSGNGDYTSLIHALRDCTEDLIIEDGVFDLVDELKNEFGQDFFDINNSRANAGSFKHGAYVNNRKLIFKSGTLVTFDLSDFDVSYSEQNDRRFSLFIIGTNVTIEGLQCIGTKNWYVIHDDSGEYNTPYTNKFKDCIIKATNIVNNNVVGGGMRDKSTTIFENCYLDDGTGLVTNRTTRYHNSDWAPNNEKISGKIVMKNCYTSGCMFFGYLGTQTDKGTIIVNNCSMGSAIDVSAQTEGAAENLELYEWLNIIR